MGAMLLSILRGNCGKLAGRPDLEAAQNDLMRMRFVRCVGRGWRPRRLPSTVSQRSWLGLMSRQPAVLLVWMCAAAGLACQRSERTTGEVGAGGTTTVSSEHIPQRDTAAGAGGASAQQEPGSDPASDSAVERVPGESVAQGGSGIEGRVVIGPECPVVEETRPCPDRPYRAELTIRRAHVGDVVAIVASDAEGLFRVELPPGWYVVDPGVPRLVTEPRAEPVALEVEVGRYAQVVVRFDSGVR